MAAPQIPNLLSLRGRGGLRGRARGRGRGGAGPDTSTSEHETPEQARERADRVVQLTDQDANLSRISAVDAGYLKDPYAHIFSPAGEVARRMPIINRGTYARTTAIDKLVTSFIISTPGPKQIVSLGAGTDTRYFRLAAAGLVDQLEYHEIDFPSNTAAKLSCMNRRADIAPFITDVVHADTSSLHSKRYHLHPLDLRQLAEPEISIPLVSTGDASSRALKRDVPTLVLSECCLCYLTETQVENILSRLIGAGGSNGHFKAAVGLIFYEPIKPDDAFGRVMTQNLEKRGIQMPNLATSLQSQQARLSKYGLTDGAKAVDIEFIMTRWVDEDERERVGRCEMLDEMEEWSLLAQHYCISFGWRLGAEGRMNSSGQNEIWSGWKRLPAQEAAS